MDKKGRHNLHKYYRRLSANKVNIRQTKSSKKEVPKVSGSNLRRNAFSAMKGQSTKEQYKPFFCTEYKPFSAKTRSQLCKMQSEIHVFKAVEQTVSKNQVSSMD